MKDRFRILQWLAGLGLCGLLIACNANAQYIVGINTGATRENQKEFIRETEAYLQKRFGASTIRFTRPVPLDELTRLIKEKKIDYFFSTAGFSRLISDTGSRELLTYSDQEFPDSEHALASTLFVRKDSGIEKFSDLRGKHFSSNWREGFFGYAVPMGEVVRQGFDPDDFFGLITYEQANPSALIPLLMQRKTDVIALPSCFWEDHFPPGSPEREQVKPISVIGTEPCLRSTETYPNWSISATAHANPEFTRQLVIALLEMPKGVNGARWSILTDYSKVDGLFRDLKMGTYSVLRKWTIKNFL